MTTIYLTIDPHEPQPELVRRAAETLRAGGLAAIPTETVYGLAADATNAEAVARIYEAKSRPADNPLIVHVDSVAMAKTLVTDWPESAQKLAEAFWPGPLTMILPKRSVIPDIVTCGSASVALRYPSHPVAQAIITASGLPLAAPSANRSGSPSPTTAAHVAHDLDGRVEMIVDSGHANVGVESTVVSLLGETPTLLRPGFVTIEDIRETLGAGEVDPAVYTALRDGQPVLSPGMKYKHYAPKARLTLVEGTLPAFSDFMTKHRDAVALCFDGEEDLLPCRALSYGCPNDPNDQANRLFDALRTLDEMGAGVAFARCPTREGVGMAVWNRMLRAAQFRVIGAE